MIDHEQVRRMLSISAGDALRLSLRIPGASADIRNTTAGANRLATEQQTIDWTNGYDTAINDAIRLVDAMRGPGVPNLASPILLRIRAELIAMRELRPEALPVAA